MSALDQAFIRAFSKKDAADSARQYTQMLGQQAAHRIDGAELVPTPHVQPQSVATPPPLPANPAPSLPEQAPAVQPVAPPETPTIEPTATTTPQPIKLVEPPVATEQPVCEEEPVVLEAVTEPEAPPEVDEEIDLHDEPESYAAWPSSALVEDIEDVSMVSSVLHPRSYLTPTPHFEVACFQVDQEEPKSEPAQATSDEDDEVTDTAEEASDTDKTKLAEAKELQQPDPAETKAEPPQPKAEDEPKPVDLGMEKPFSPAWEVDAFQWPAICGKLRSSRSSQLIEAGKKLFAASREGLNVLALTSSQRGEGRTTLSICLAQSAAAAGVRVAVVDADFENPQLSNNLGFDAQTSWHTVITYDVPLEEAAVASLKDSVTVFPLQQLDKDQSWVPYSKGLSEAVERISEKFELVIVDLGSSASAILERDNALHVDAAIVVRDVRKTSHDQALASVRQLRQAGIRSVGVVDNFSTSQAKSA